MPLVRPPQPRRFCTGSYVRRCQMQELSRVRWSQGIGVQQTLAALKTQNNKARLATAQRRRDNNERPYPLDNLELSLAQEALNLGEPLKSLWVAPFSQAWRVGALVRASGTEGIDAKAMSLEIFGNINHDRVLRIEWQVAQLRRYYRQPLRMCSEGKYKWLSEYEVWETKNPYDFM